MQILRVLAVLKRPAQRTASRGIAKGRRAPPAPVVPTGDLINLLSNERLRLYRQVSGRPLPRAVRVRLGEIVRELDRLWDLRRREMVTFPVLNGSDEIPKPRSVAPAKSPDRRPPGVPVPASA
ncbi:MAG TPA: hypothetical protein VEW91_10215 [bacterium]|nr:hypothetical protein [bacterium]